MAKNSINTQPMTPQQALNNLAQAIASNNFSAPLSAHQVLQQSITILDNFIKPTSGENFSEDQTLLHQTEYKNRKERKLKT